MVCNQRIFIGPAFLGLFILLVGSPLFATGWQNPSERYMEAYKAYENAPLPLQEDEMKHFVYFARDREALVNHSFLSAQRFDGAQIMYSWRQLEGAKGEYDFSVIEEDLNYLQSRGKGLFLQIQDATFSPQYVAVPEYLKNAEYDGGVIEQREDDGSVEGWVAKRWNPEVRARFAIFLKALGERFDGRVEGVNLQESAIGISSQYDVSFSSEAYVEGIKANMKALKEAFPQSTTMQYANFIPGEWLPWEDFGYLESIYDYGESIGVGLGAPDLMVRRKGQLNNPLAMMHEKSYTAPLGIAVQDGNYIGATNSNEVRSQRKNIVPMLHAFAQDFLKVRYMFWSYQEPYFTEDVLPAFGG
ncbi:MAG: hypothetical protein MI717_04385 [Spirochaetales bacterium]|nr:hypothetical protein [Spirochaetales bacterium]